MTLAQLRDAVLERHVKVVYVEATTTEPFCDFCGHEWPCPEFRLATALSPENVAVGLPDALSLASEQDQTYEYSEEPGSPFVKFLATALLGAIPVDTQEGT